MGPAEEEVRLFLVETRAPGVSIEANALTDSTRTIQAMARDRPKAATTRISRSI